MNDLNTRSLRLLKDFIAFKENILREVGKGKLFTVNYPLLIEHILREARLYCTTVGELLDNRQLSYKNLRKTEKFWNQIMMEHALFIRGLLDPTEEALIQTANEFAMAFRELFADHVLREANHYIRLLGTESEGQEGGRRNYGIILSCRSVGTTR